MDDLRQLYNRWLLDLWQAGPSEREAIARDIVTDDFFVHQGGQPDETRGPARLMKLVETGGAPFADIRMEISVGPIVEGDFVAARWVFHGSYRGGLPGADAPEGTQINVAGMDLLRAEDGRFAEYWSSSDRVDLLSQLGVR
jgi:hypothetical protein